MSVHLWFDLGRSFPRAPVLSSLTLRPDFLISGALIAVLVLVTITSHRRRYLVASVVLTAVLVLLDQTRLQPWVYQYAIVLALLSFASIANQQAVVAANQLVIATLYFWSGLHKLSWSFVYEVAPRLFDLSGLSLSPGALTIIALTIAVFETLIGIGLLVRRTRRIAVVLACLMHTIILFTLIFSHINTAVWPWNLAMIAITFILFWRNEDSLFEYLRWRRDYLPTAVLICSVLPALSFMGWWDLYLSGALYSGKSSVGVMRISEGLRERLPAKARELTFKTGRGELMLPFYEWSVADLNVPPYPEGRVYRQIARDLCKLDIDTQVNALIIKGRPALTNGSYELTVTACAELLSR